MEINVGEGVGIDAQSMLTGRCCVIGQSGSGKSYLVGVMVEELSKNQLPYVIIDTEGEYNALKAAFPMLWVGGEKGDLPIDVNYAKLVEKSIASRTPVIFDVSEEVDKEARVSAFLSELYRVEDRLRSPYLVIIEEADKFAPQTVGKERSMVDEISVRGRKRGIGLVVATQRPANINKNVLAQCSYGFIGKLTIENDLSAVEILFENKAELASLPALKTGEFISFGLGKNERFRVKQRVVKHGGSTPVLGSQAEEAEDLDTLIAELKGKRSRDGRRQQAPGRDDADLPLVISEGVDIQFAREFANRIERKRFVVFGEPVETVESVTERYMPLALVKFSTPTKRKNEYEERYIMVDSRLSPIALDGRIRRDGALLRKRIRLSDAERKLLSIVNGKRDTELDRLSKQTGISEGKIFDAIERFEDAGLVSHDKDRIRVPNRKRYLMGERPGSEARDVEEGDAAEARLRMDEIKEAVGIAFPMSTVDSAREIYLPFYEIKLRMRDRVRIFRLDAVYGKELDYKA